jgi:hypothetical protein
MTIAVRRWLWPKSLLGKSAYLTTAGFIVVVLLWIAAYFTTNKQLAEAWAFSERFGLSNDVNVLFGPPISDKENAAVPLRELMKLAKRQCLIRGADPRGTTPSLIPERMMAPESLAANLAYESAWVETDRRETYRTLADLSKPLVEISPMPLFDLQYVTTAELAVSKWLAANGRKEEAIARLLRHSRLLRKFSGKETTLSAAMLSTGGQIAIVLELNRLVRSPGRPSPHVFDAVETEIALHEKVTPILLFAAQTERIAFAHYIRKRAPCGEIFAMTPYTNLDQISLLQYFNESMQNLTLAEPESQEAENALLKRKKDSSQSYFARAFHPISSQYTSGASLLHLRRPYLTVLPRCLRIVNAMAKNNDFNADLNSLGLTSASLIDPFDGKPMRVKQTLAGPIIYSIGRNLKDDAGRIGQTEGDLDIGLGPSATSKSAERK